jgi:hypothetical protein
MTSDDNYTIFRECLSSAIVTRSEGQPKTSKRRGKAKRNGRKDVTRAEVVIKHERADPEELAEFIDVLINSTQHLPQAQS